MPLKLAACFIQGAGMSRSIEQIVIHCSASLNGRSLGDGGKSAAEVMDAWHSRHGFMRRAAATPPIFTPHFKFKTWILSGNIKTSHHLG
jgi:hypothetical protein